MSPAGDRSLRLWRARTALLCICLGIAVGAPPGGASAQAGRPQAGGQAGERAAKDAKRAKRGGPPRIAARAWILVDPRDGKVLASKAGDRRLPIASATKLMTAYLALHRLKPKERLRAPAYRALPVESQIRLRAGERMTVRDLLYALILESANDAAVTLARGVSGSVPAFVSEMNRQAQLLGLTNTSFANPIGLDDPGNYSSARDLAELAGELLEDPLFREVADAPAAVLRTGDRPRRIDSRNTLLRREPYLTGVKTGHTIQAGWILVGSATRDGTSLVSVVLGAGSEAARDAETLKLLDYGFSLYRSSVAVQRGEELAIADLDYRDDQLSLVAQREIAVSVRRGQVIDAAVDAPDEVSGRVEEGEELGTVTVTVDGERAGSAPLVAAESVSAASFLQKAAATAQSPLVLLPAGVFVIVVGMLLAARGRRLDAGPEGEEPDPGADRRERERTPEERRKMHEERMRRRRRRRRRSQR